MKICARCKASYPSTNEYFYYRDKKRGWLSSWCKPCKIQHRKDNIATELENQRVRRRARNICNICNTKPADFQHRYCKSCHKENIKIKKREDKALYKSRLRKAKPKWANGFFLREIYDLARLRTSMTGIEWHVDHMIPIRGINVSGLHTHENLRVILGKENIEKGNHYSMTHEGMS